MKKLFIVLCVSVALAILMAFSALAQAKVELRVSHAWPAERLPAQVKFDEEFMKRHPNIVVKRENIPWADYKQKKMTEAAAGTLPDVFYMQDSWSLFWISYGMALNIELFVQKDKEYGREFFHKGSLEPFTWKGNLHGIPYDWNTYGTLAYNVDLFNKAGLLYPDKSWTFSGLHGSNNCGEVIAHRRDGLQEFSKAGGIHIRSNRETDITFRVNTGCREEVFGYINANEKIVHILMYMGKTQTYKLYNTNS